MAHGPRSSSLGGPALIGSLSLLGAASAGWSESTGDSACPCLPRATVDSLRQSVANLSWHRLVPEGYGHECAAHDLAFVNHSVVGDAAACAGAQPAPWCAAKWCYVGQGCRVAKRPSTLNPVLEYSYETCGYLNTFTSFLLSDSLVNTTIRVARMTNTGGWKGSYCSGNGPCTGPVAVLLEHALHAAGVKTDTLSTWQSADLSTQPGAFPPPVMRQVLADNPKQKSAFTACTYATGMGYVDLCIGAFTVRVDRMQRSSMIVLYAEPVYLVARPVREGESFSELLMSVFQPFEPELWCTLFASLLAIGVVMFFHERGKQGAFAGLSWARGIPLACYECLLSFFGGGSSFAPCTPGGRLSNLALSLLVLVSVTSYTAELASFLVVQKAQRTVFNTINDVIAAKATLCVRNSLRQPLIAAGMPEHLLDVRLSRSDIIPGIEAGDCSVAAMTLEDFQKVREGGDACDMVRSRDPVFAGTSGVPVSSTVHRALEVHIVQLQRKGEWERILKEETVEEGCKQKAESEKMAVGRMLGPFVICAALVAISMLAGIGHRIYQRVAVSRSLEVGPPDDPKQQAPSAEPETSGEPEQLAEVQAAPAHAGELAVQGTPNEGLLAHIAAVQVGLDRLKEQLQPGQRERSQHL